MSSDFINKRSKIKNPLTLVFYPYPYITTFTFLTKYESNQQNKKGDSHNLFHQQTKTGAIKSNTKLRKAIIHVWEIKKKIFIHVLYQNKPTFTLGTTVALLSVGMITFHCWTLDLFTLDFSSLLTSIWYCTTGKCMQIYQFIQQQSQATNLHFSAFDHLIPYITTN